MNQETETESAVPSPETATPHCQHRSASSRRFCRMPVSDPASGLCSRHAAQLKKDRDAANLAARLIGDTGEFTSAVAINRSLGELYKLLARDEIAPRRAAVMAYTCNLLLRTLPAIEHELHAPGQGDNTIIMDIPSAVACRAAEARGAQHSERGFYKSLATRYGSYATSGGSDSSRAPEREPDNQAQPIISGLPRPNPTRTDP